MKTKITLILIVAVIIAISRNAGIERNHHSEFNHTESLSGAAYAYPPGVGILSPAQNCLVCHVNNGQWKDDGNTIIDILDKETKKSLRQQDGTFLIETVRNQPRTVFTVMGSKKDASLPVPYRNAWLYVDTATIGTSSLSKFVPGWEVNLPMSCRVVGDKLEGYENADITVLPMTVLPTGSAKNGEVVLQAMLTKGESVKGNAKEGMSGSYFERKVKLVVKN